MIVFLLGITILLGLYMAWSIGANDVANSMADAVGSRAITIRWAIIAAGICEFAGAILVGSHVTDTIRKGIVSPQVLVGNPEVFVLGMMSALLAAAAWLHVATWMGMPVSTTHSIVGAVAGFGVVAAGWGAVNWGKMGQIVASWFISPVAGGLVAFLLFKLINRLILGRRRPARAAVSITPYIVFLAALVVTLATLYKGLKHIVAREASWLTGNVAILLSVGIGILSALVARILIKRYLKGKHKRPLREQLELVERTFAPLVVITSCSVAFAHGANDVANAIGPLAAVVDIIRSGSVKMQVHVPPWILALGGAGIVLGLSTYGYRVMRTVGNDITQITPSRGVAADIAATMTVLICTRLKLPVSTTHTLVGAILGIGLARGLGAVNRRVTRNIFGSWLITVPTAAVLAILFFLAGRLFLLHVISKAIHAG
jgi:PiT family inorganic phosphate transporter